MSQKNTKKRKSPLSQKAKYSPRKKPRITKKQPKSHSPKIESAISPWDIE